MNWDRIEGNWKQVKGKIKDATATSASINEEHAMKASNLLLVLMTAAGLSLAGAGTSASRKRSRRT
jgi:hypothetical protein